MHLTIFYWLKLRSMQRCITLLILKYPPMYQPRWSPISYYMCTGSASGYPYPTEHLGPAGGGRGNIRQRKDSRGALILVNMPAETWSYP